jgi:hypothetical protein
MGLDDRVPLIDQLGDTAREVLGRSQATGKTTTEVALELAQARLAAARGD